MARPLRIEYPGAFYHVMNRGLERRSLFRDCEDYKGFLSLLETLYKRFKVVVHAYCLMTNHYHLLLETMEGNLSRAMRHLDGVYTQRFNKKYHRIGPLLQGRYKALLVEKESYGLELARYIHLNPVKAGLAKRPTDYPYSSYRLFLGQQNPPLFLETHWLLGQFSPLPQKAQQAFHQFTLEGLLLQEDIFKQIRGGVLLGGDRFFETIWEKYLQKKKDRELQGLRELKRIEIHSIESRVKALGLVSSMEKKVLAYMLHQWTPLKLKEIGQRIGKAKYVTVSQIIRRLEQERSRNPSVDRLLQTLEKELM